MPQTRPSCSDQPKPDMFRFEGFGAPVPLSADRLFRPLVRWNTPVLAPGEPIVRTAHQLGPGHALGRGGLFGRVVRRFGDVVRRVRSPPCKIESLTVRTAIGLWLGNAKRSPKNLRYKMI